MLFALKSIEITSFRGVHGPLVLDFSSTKPGLYFVRGVNYVEPRLGSNGAGKSTCVSEALVWALTGRISRSQRPGSDVENREVDRTTSVKIKFALDDAVYQVERTRNPNSLLLNDKKVEQQEIDAVLPLTDAALRKSILIDQFGEMFLSLRPEAKSQIFTETLGLDRWIRLADTAGIRVDADERQLQALLRKQDSNKAALAEVRDQREAAVAGEEKFEKEIKHLLDVAIKKARQARDAAAGCCKELDDARKASASVKGAELETKRNELVSGLRKMQRSLADAEAGVLSGQRELQRFEAELARYVPSSKVCPECGQKVAEDHILDKRKSIQHSIVAANKLLAERRGGAAKLKADLLRSEELITLADRELVDFHAALLTVAAAAERSIAADREAHHTTDVVDELKKRENPFTKLCDDLESRAAKLVSYGKELVSEADVSTKRIAIYQFWQKGFREIRLQQIDAALVELELATTRHAQALGLEDWEIRFATDRETKKGTISHGFTVTLYPPGEDKPVNWDTYCGGEVQRWQLAATFGLSEVLLARAGIDTDFEVLDEPSQHLSPEGIDELLVCLSDRARELNRRIFIIDHNALSAGSFDGVVTVAKKEGRGTYIEDSGGVITIGRVSRERVSL